MRSGAHVSSHRRAPRFRGYFGFGFGDISLGASAPRSAISASSSRATAFCPVVARRHTVSLRLLPIDGHADAGGCASSRAVARSSATPPHTDFNSHFSRVVCGRRFPAGWLCCVDSFAAKRRFGMLSFDAAVGRWLFRRPFSPSPSSRTSPAILSRVYDASTIDAVEVSALASGGRRRYAV